MTERDRGDDDASDWLSQQFDEPDDGPDESAAGGRGAADVPPPRRANGARSGAPAVPPAAASPSAPDAAPAEGPAQAEGFSWGLRPRGAARRSAAADPGAGTDPDAAGPDAAGPDPAGSAPGEAAPGSAADADDATQATPAPGFDPRAAATDPSALAVDPFATQAMPVAGFDERAAATPASLERVLDGAPGAEPVGGAFTDLVGGVAPTITDPAPVEAEPASDGIRRRAAARGRWRPTRTQKTLLWAAGALLAIIALIGLYLLGRQLAAPVEPEAKPTPSATPSVTPTPTPTVEPPVAAGPLPAGVHEWDALQGGECLDPFASPWAEEFTVVDCAAPHPAQLVDRGTFPSEPEAEYPGADALQAQINLLCTPPSVIDFAAAAQYPDVVVQGAYPVTAEEWDEGYRDYFCFVTRSSGEPFTGSIAVPQG